MRKVYCVLLVILFCLTSYTVFAAETPSEQQGLFPEDLFRNAEVCGQYFVNADCEENQYVVIDGEYVLILPNHKVLDHMYTKSPIPYSRYVVSFDFMIQVSPDGEGYDEMDFLFGVAEQGYPFHQAAMAGEGDGSFNFIHHKFDGRQWTRYDADRIFYDLFETDTWYEFAAEITPESVDIYINNEWLGSLSEVMEIADEPGRIGLRGGSAGGWKIKNMQVISDEIIEAPTPSVPAALPTETVTANPHVSSLPEHSVDPTATQEPVASNASVIVPAVIVGLVLLLGVGISIVIIQKKKK